MPPRNWRLRVEDMLDALCTARGFVAEMTQEEFRGDRRTVDAVVRNLEVAGEGPGMSRMTSGFDFPRFRGRTSPTSATSWSTSTSAWTSASSGKPSSSSCDR